MAHEGEIVLRRSLAADGKSRAFINDEAVSVGLLKDLGGLLLEVHGQADDRGLFDIATHRGLLDAFGASGERGAAKSRRCMPQWDAAREALAGLEGAAPPRPRRMPIMCAPPPRNCRASIRSRAKKKAWPASAP